jgi:hypothetical protein
VHDSRSWPHRSSLTPPRVQHRASHLHRPTTVSRLFQAVSVFEICQHGRPQGYTRRFMVHKQRTCPLRAARWLVSRCTKLHHACRHQVCTGRQCNDTHVGCSSHHRTVGYSKCQEDRQAHECAGMLVTLTPGLLLHGPTRQPTGQTRKQ